VSSFASAASLIIATADLKAVQAVTSAIRAADLESGDVLTPSGIIEKPGLPPSQAPAQQVDRYDATPSPKQAVAAKQPTYSPARQSSGPSHWVPPGIRTSSVPAMTPYCDVAPEPVCVSTNPIEAPWKVLPWMDRPQPRIVLVRQIKLIAAGSDMSGRGQMLDLVV
jgi:hypothetical protein